MKNNKNLEKIGLDQREIEVYSACLEGRNTPTLIAETVGTSRSAVYLYVDQLINKGFVRRLIKGKRKLIVAVEPKEAIGEYLKKQRQEFNRAEKELESVAKKLAKKTTGLQTKTRISYYEGRKEIRPVIDRMLKENVDILWFGSVKAEHDILEEKRFYKLMTLPRMKQKTTAYAITDKRVLDKRRSSEEIGNFRRFRILDENIDLPSVLTIYGECILIAVLDSGRVRIVEIKDKIMAETLLLMYKMLWNKLGEEDRLNF